MASSKKIKGMRFATFMPEATNMAYSTLLSGSGSQANLLIPKRNAMVADATPTGILSSPNRDQLIAIKQEQRNKKKIALDKIKTQQDQFRVTTNSRMTGEYWKAATARSKIQNKPTEAELFKIIKKRDRRSLASNKPTFLDKFYRKNGIVEENKQIDIGLNTISAFRSKAINSKSRLS